MDMRRDFRAWIAGLSVAGLVGFLVFAQFPAAVERVYIEGAGPAVARPVALAAATVGFSLAEWVEFIAIGLGLVALLRLGMQVYKPTTSRVQVVKSAALSFAAILFPVLLLFYGVWGLSYARVPAAERFGFGMLDPEEDPQQSADELERLGARLVDLVNEQYVAIHGSTDAGVPTEPVETDLQIDRALDLGYRRAQQSLNLHPSFALERGPAKPLRSSILFTYLGIGGFYFPFTGEANYNHMAPRWVRPHTIAHEKAHQRMVASENEANFYGFLGCVYSDSPAARYAGYYFAQRQLLRTLSYIDPQRTIDLVQQRHPGVQRDAKALYAFWTGYDGPLNDLGSAVNDAYLRLNQVEGGVQSYSRSVELLVLFSRSRDGSLVVDE